MVFKLLGLLIEIEGCHSSSTSSELNSSVTLGDSALKNDQVSPPQPPH
jgi:hypothetical protein